MKRKSGLGNIGSFAIPGLVTGALLLLGSSLRAGAPATKEAHCRTFAGTVDTLLPGAIELLLDQQYVVQSVNPQAGTLSFFKLEQSGAYGNRHIVRQEGTLFIQTGPSHASTLRLLITQEWTDVGIKGIVGMGVETDTDEVYYKAIFGGLEQKWSGKGR